MKSIILDNIEIEIVKKNIKNIHLTVHPPYGTVKLSVPERMSNEAINKFAISRLSWIKKQREKYKFQEKIVPAEFISGESHYFLGTKYLLNVIEKEGKQHAELRNNEYINLYVRPGNTAEKRGEVLTEWYRSNLKTIIPEYIEKWEKIIGVSVKEWGVKLMKTRWGTCNTQAKRVWINLELAKKNTMCLEYIVVHELVHLLERHHNNIFYGYMDKFLPEWKVIRNNLNNLNNLKSN
ncbi:MAG: SprT family zinc-dependent metalloprotease [Sedimentibacter sp.]